MMWAMKCGEIAPHGGLETELNMIVGTASCILIPGSELLWGNKVLLVPHERLRSAQVQ